MSKVGPKFRPSEDGVTHINISTQGKTELGQALSLDHYSKFTHSFYGPFKSITGFMIWLTAKDKTDRLRTLFPKDCRKIARGLGTTKLPDNYNAIVIDAIFQKIQSSPDTEKAFRESELPLTLYYLYGPGNIPIDKSGVQWICRGLEDIRAKLKRGEEIPVVDYPNFFD